MTFDMRQYPARAVSDTVYRPLSLGRLTEQVTEDVTQSQSVP